MEKIDLNRMAELLNNFTLDSDNNTNSKNESEIENKIESENFNYQTIKCDNMTLIVPDEILNNLYLVGGGTHPGSGLPTIYESGRITANLIEEDFSK